MIPVQCSNNGDCVRACVASILELPSGEVPDFFAGATSDNGGELQQSMQEWLARRGRVAAMLSLPPHWSLDRVFKHMQSYYRDTYYMLWCHSGGDDHSVICLNAEMVHNPAWYKSPIDGPHSLNCWIIVLLARIA